MGRKKKHHYLNQAYLRGFTSDPRQRELWLYDRENGNVRRSSPRDSFNVCDLYTFKKGDNQDSESLENLLGTVETQIGPALAKVIAGHWPNPSELSWIHTLIALCMVRTPASLQRAEDMVRASMRATMEILEDQGKIQPFPGTGAWAGRRMSELVDQGKVKINILPNLPLSLMGTFLDLAKRIAELNCCFLRATGNLSFVTSDHPVVMFEPVLYGKFPFNGLRNPFVELTFPISRRLCFFGTWRPISTGFFSATNDTVRKVILRHSFFAQRFVAYPAKSKFVETMVKETVGLGISSVVRNERSEKERGIFTITTREFKSEASHEYYFARLAPILPPPVSDKKQ